MNLDFTSAAQPLHYAYPRMDPAQITTELMHLLRSNTVPTSHAPKPDWIQGKVPLGDHGDFGASVEELLTASSITEDAPTKLVPEEFLHACIHSAAASMKTPEAAFYNADISTAEHENTQLVYNRKSSTGTQMPFCCRGEDCDARFLPGAPGPLNPYLRPDEEQEFEATGRMPGGDMLCLLCIRSIIQGQTELKGMMQGKPRVMAPFCNLVDVPGGYFSSAIGTLPKFDYPVFAEKPSDFRTLTTPHPFDRC